jgi:nucleotide-binding universal stress UspA family protein
MEKNIQTSRMLLVPWDFSLMAEFALEHALRIAKTLDKEITLLHVVEKETSDSDRVNVLKKLDEKAAEVQNLHGILPKTILLEGHIFSAISNYAGETEANMVIMGTHGIQGAQKLTGSWALKVIAGSKVPFLVVQSHPNNTERFRNIVFPIDFRSEDKEKLYWAIYLGKYFNSTVHIIRKPATDKSLVKKTNVNLNFAIRFLIQNNLEYKIQEAPKGNFDKETVKFAQEINADLILIMTSKHITFFTYFLGAPEQDIIANSARIPVMCVNPRANFAKLGQFLYGGN